MVYTKEPSAYPLCRPFAYASLSYSILSKHSNSGTRSWSLFARESRDSMQPCPPRGLTSLKPICDQGATRHFNRPFAIIVLSALMSLSFPLKLSNVPLLFFSHFLIKYIFASTLLPIIRFWSFRSFSDLLLFSFLNCCFFFFARECTGEWWKGEHTRLDPLTHR